MRLPKFTLFRPSSVEESLALLNQYQQEARAVAGGTALAVEVGQRLLTPKYVVSLKGVRGMDYIKYSARNGLRIGAMTSIDGLNTSPVVRERYPVLSEAAGEVGVPSIRYMGTVGGNLCLDTRCIYYNQSDFWRQVRTACFKRGGDECHAVKGGKQCYAACQSDLAPVLVALEAKVRLQRKGGERVLPVSEFFTGDGENPNVLKPDEMVTEVQIPPLSAHSRGSYQKLRIREAIDFPLASVAAVIDVDDGKVCRKVRLVIGAIAPEPIEAKDAEKVLEGKGVTDSLLEEAAEAAFKAAHPVANLSIDTTYRRKMVRVLLKRAVNQALGR